MSNDSNSAGTGRKVVSVSTAVTAAPETIFELLADPRQHSLIDGSGSVKGALDGAPERLSLGAKFGMSMRIGAPYRITNEVVEFEEGRRIAWRHMGGHIWRYVLEPAGDGSDTTTVTEEFEWGTSKAPFFLKATGAVARNERAIRATLERLSAHFAR
jgi:hypothetical protein